MEKKENNTIKFKTIAIIDKNKTEYQSVDYDLSKLPENYVIVKVDYSAIGPYDTGILSGHIDVARSNDLPLTFGFEGVGVIEFAGSNVDKSFIGKNVVFMCDSKDSNQIRAYSEYSIIPFTSTLILENKDNYKQNAYLVGNPFTARGFLENVLLKDKHTSIVMDTASSSLGKMIAKLCVRHEIKLIAILRSDDSTEKLKKISSDIKVHNSSSKDFIEQISESFKENNPTLYVTFQGGNLPSRVFEVMPRKSAMVTLGNIQREEMFGFSTVPFIFQEKSIFGYTVFDYFAKLLSEKKFSEVAQELMKDSAYLTELADDMSEFTLSEFEKGVEYYKKNSSKGKILFKRD